MGLKAGLLITHPVDGRVMFVLPWMNRTLVGTTDTFTDFGPDELAAEPKDADYLLAATNYYLCRSLSRSDVIATLVGMRPLLNRKAKQPSIASREFAIIRSSTGLWSIAGGKYTTYRSMAEKLVDQVITRLGSSVPSRTAQYPLIGTPAEDWELFRSRERVEIGKTYRIDPSLTDHLVNRYGVRARSVVEEYSADSDLWSAVVSGEPDVWAEFRYQTQHEMAVLPADHLLRRTRLGLFHSDLFAAELKWPVPNQSAKLGS
jgi:glycerol-3-phosphate dehydrogenase